MADMIARTTTVGTTIVRTTASTIAGTTIKATGRATSTPATRTMATRSSPSRGTSTSRRTSTSHGSPTGLTTSTVATSSVAGTTAGTGITRTDQGRRGSGCSFANTPASGGSRGTSFGCCLLLQRERHELGRLRARADRERQVLLAALHVGHRHATHHAGDGDLAQHRTGLLVIGAHDVLAGPPLARDQERLGHKERRVQADAAGVRQRLAPERRMLG